LGENVREDIPDQESWQVDLRISEDGEPRIAITAPYLAEYENKDSTYSLLSASKNDPSERVTAYIFDQNGDSSATMTADRLYYYDQERRFDAQGNVRVVTRNGKHLESEQLLWFDADRKVRTPGFVRITTNLEQVQGYQLEADEDLKTYTLKRVTGKREVPASE